VSAPRDQYADVGQSARAVMTKACRAGLSQGDWRVLTAVLHETLTWSRHVDVLSVARIGAVAGLASDGQIRAALVRLRDLGLIVYTAQRGRPKAGERGRCQIGIPDANTLPMDVPVPPGAPAAAPENRRPVAADTPPASAEAKPLTRRSGYPAENRRTGGATPEKLFREEEPPPSPAPSAAPRQGALLVAVPGGGGSTSTTTTDTDPADPDDAVPADVRTVLDAIAAALPLPDRGRALLAARIRPALAAGWDPAVLGAHLPAGVREITTTTAALMLHRLSVLPESPAVCPCGPCRRHTAAVEAEIRREADRLARARAAEQHQAAAGDAAAAAARHDALDDALGAVLHGRIVAAAVGANPVHQRSRRSPALVRSLAANVYADHGHDIARIRSYAESLPPGPAESGPVTDSDGLPLPAGPSPAATETTLNATQSPAPNPTHADGTVRPSLAVLEAAIAARIGAA
jgi:hypothetical protein